MGAEQENHGDLHNLFGDTNAIHVAMDEDHGYRIERVIEGDSIAEVLSYVQYDKQDLVGRMRDRLVEAVSAGDVSSEEAALLMRRYEEGLAAYTYLTDDDAEYGRSNQKGAVVGRSDRDSRQSAPRKVVADGMSASDTGPA